MDTDLRADRVLADSTSLGEAFKRLADTDRTYSIVVEGAEPHENDDDR